MTGPAPPAEAARPCSLLERARRFMREPTAELMATQAAQAVQRLRTALLVEIVAVWVYVPISLGRQQPRAALSHFVAGCLLLVLRVLAGRYRGAARPSLLIHLNPTILLVDLVVIAMVTGQERAITPWFLVLMPLGAAPEGLAAIVGWTAASALAMLGIDLSHHLAQVRADALAPPASWAVARLSLLLLLFAYVLASRRSSNMALADLAERERVIRAQAESLAAARDEAIQAARVKSQFLANMSHEIRTPLAGVIGIGDLLAATPLDARQRELVDLLSQSGHTLLHVINDVLDYSKLEAGQVALDSAPYDLVEAVRGVVALFRIARGGREGHLPVELEVAAGAPRRVLGDETRLRQVLSYLVANAVKFTLRGRVTVRVGALSADGMVEISVEDTGQGIDPADQGRLFEPFTQVDASPARRHGGTGLGLAICRHLVTRMGGHIGFESTLGRGSTFRFRVPAPDAPPAAPSGEAVVQATEPSLPAVAPASPSLAVLVAEDNPVNQRLIREALRQLGFEPDVVGDGDTAARACRHRRYDVVLMDLQMPGTDGIEATRRIRAALPRGTPGSPRIVALTASVQPEQEAASRAAGMDDFLRKPFTVEDLRRAVRPPARGGPAPEPSPEGIPAAPPGPSRSAPLGVLDPRRLAALRAISPDERTFRELLDSHRATSERLVSILREAAKRDDREALVRAAHSLASSSAMFGASAMAEACRALEHHGRDLSGEELVGRLARLVDEHDRAAAALALLRDEPPAEARAS